MPLTDVGKPAKPLLRRDAAQRTFTVVLGEAAGGAAKVGVAVQPDETSGSKATITLTPANGQAKAQDKADVEQRVRKAMAAYATAYTIEWTS
jgi:hypothetical protein